MVFNGSSFCSSESWLVDQHWQRVLKSPQQGFVLSFADSHRRVHRNSQNANLLIYVNNVTTRWGDIHISLSKFSQKDVRKALVPGAHSLNRKKRKGSEIYTFMLYGIGICYCTASSSNLGMSCQVYGPSYWPDGIPSLLSRIYEYHPLILAIQIPFLCYKVWNFVVHHPLWQSEHAHEAILRIFKC